MRTKHYYYDYGYATKKRNKTRDDAGIKFLFSVVFQKKKDNIIITSQC